VLTVMESLVSDYDQGGHIRGRYGSSLPGIAPSNAYPTRDGKEMIIGANQDTVYRRLCEVMGRPELADDERFATHRARGDNAAVLDELVTEWTSRHDADAMIADLSDAGVPVGLAYRAPEMLKDPQFIARESIVRVPDPKRGEIAMQNVFPRLSESPGEVRSVGPELGANSGQVLENWLGMAAGEIDALRDKGVV